MVKGCVHYKNKNVNATVSDILIRIQSTVRKRWMSAPLTLAHLLLSHYNNSTYFNHAYVRIKCLSFCLSGTKIIIESKLTQMVLWNFVEEGFVT